MATEPSSDCKRCNIDVAGTNGDVKVCAPQVLCLACAFETLPEFAQPRSLRRAAFLGKKIVGRRAGTGYY